MNAAVARRSDYRRDDPAGLRAELAALQAMMIKLIDPAAEIRYRRRLCREAYRAGQAEGFKRGYEMRAKELDAAWNEAATPIARGGTAHTELEVWRWGPGGREHFADPRPGDFQGGPGGDGS